MKQKTQRTLPLFIIALCIIPISWADTWQDLEKSSLKIDSIQASFTQTKHMTLLAKPLVSTGRFYYRKPGSLRWEYDAPVRSVLMHHRGALRRYIMSRNGYVEDDAAKLKSMAVVLQEITGWFGGKFDSNPDFTAGLRKSPRRSIVLTPKSDGLRKIISSIVLDLSDTEGVIDRVTIHEGEKNGTVIEFTGIGINRPIPDDVFRKP